MPRKPKILAVDDEIFNLDILESDLQDAGFDIVRALDGNMAVKKLAEIQDIDLILLDRMMPNMDGIEVLRFLKSHPLYNTIPVIMQTADGRSMKINEGLKEGALYYLVKPYDEKVLIETVIAALGSILTGGTCH